MNFRSLVTAVFDAAIGNAILPIIYSLINNQSSGIAQVGASPLCMAVVSSDQAIIAPKALCYGLALVRSLVAKVSASNPRIFVDEKSAGPFHRRPCKECVLLYSLMRNRPVPSSSSMRRTHPRIFVDEKSADPFHRCPCRECILVYSSTRNQRIPFIVVHAENASSHTR
jgi:hypothetical protein